MESAGLLMGFLILNLPWVRIIFVDLDTRQDPTCVSLLYLSQDCALLLYRGLRPYCKSVFPSLVVYLVYA